MVSYGKHTVLVPCLNTIYFYSFYKHTIIHQSTLIKRNLFQKYGLYREDLKIVGDWEFFTRVLFLHNCIYKSYPITISIFDSTGLSSQKENYPIALKERSEVLTKYFSNFLPDYELIKEKSTYKYLKWVNKKPILLKFFILKARIINKLFN
jgi:hypothetical protein